jgi:DNA-binding NarL/FixJ family response regulator
VWLVNWFKKLDEEPPPPDERPRILAVAMPIDDRVSLGWMGDEYNWKIRFTQSPREAFALASRHPFEVILCDRTQPGYPWREVMYRLAACSPQSCILLVSPVSDDGLWQSVLQHGGYDVLIRPLKESTTVRTIQSALRFIFPEKAVSVGCQY